DLVFVGIARLQPGNEYFPYTRWEAQPHRVPPPVPVIETAHHRNTSGIGRPDGETDALHTLDLHDLRTKDAGQFPMVAFGEQIEIHLTQLRTEAVRIFGYMHATRPADAQQIGLRMRQPREEQARDLPLL